MMKSIYIASDMKQLFREPMMALLFCLPIFIAPVIRLIITYAVPFSQSYISYDIHLYYDYIVAIFLTLVPGMLGVVMGFMFLDDQDAGILSLLSVTPFGQTGYLFLRIGLLMSTCILYIFYSYYVLGIYLISFLNLFFLAILEGLYGGILALVFINIATDKVKGLTMAKLMNLVSLFIFADLLNSPLISSLASLFPTYWFYKIIQSQASISSLLYAGLSSLICLLILALISKRKLYSN